MTMMNKSYPIFYIKKENLQHSSKKTYKYLTEIHYNKEKKRRKLGWRSKKVYKRWIRRMETQKNYKQRKKLTNKQKRKKKKDLIDGYHILKKKQKKKRIKLKYKGLKIKSHKVRFSKIRFKIKKNRRNIVKNLQKNKYTALYKKNKKLRIKRIKETKKKALTVTQKLRKRKKGKKKRMLTVKQKMYKHKRKLRKRLNFFCDRFPQKKKQLTREEKIREEILALVNGTIKEYTLKQQQEAEQERKDQDFRNTRLICNIANGTKFKRVPKPRKRKMNFKHIKKVKKNKLNEKSQKHKKYFSHGTGYVLINGYQMYQPYRKYKENFYKKHGGYKGYKGRRRYRRNKGYWGYRSYRRYRNYHWRNKVSKKKHYYIWEIHKNKTLKHLKKEKKRIKLSSTKVTKSIFSLLARELPKEYLTRFKFFEPINTVKTTSRGFRAGYSGIHMVNYHDSLTDIYYDFENLHLRKETSIKKQYLDIFERKSLKRKKNKINKNMHKIRKTLRKIIYSNKIIKRRRNRTTKLRKINVTPKRYKNKYLRMTRRIVWNMVKIKLKNIKKMLLKVKIFLGKRKFFRKFKKVYFLLINIFKKVILETIGLRRALKRKKRSKSRYLTIMPFKSKDFKTKFLITVLTFQKSFQFFMLKKGKLNVLPLIVKQWRHSNNNYTKKIPGPIKISTKELHLNMMRLNHKRLILPSTIDELNEKRRSFVYDEAFFDKTRYYSRLDIKDYDDDKNERFELLFSDLREYNELLVLQKERMDGVSQMQKKLEKMRYTKYNITFDKEEEIIPFSDLLDEETFQRFLIYYNFMDNLKREFNKPQFKLYNFWDYMFNYSLLLQHEEIVMEYYIDGHEMHEVFPELNVFFITAAIPLPASVLYKPVSFDPKANVPWELLYVGPYTPPTISASELLGVPPSELYTRFINTPPPQKPAPQLQKPIPKKQELIPTKQNLTATKQKSTATKQKPK